MELTTVRKILMIGLMLMVCALIAPVSAAMSIAPAQAGDNGEWAIGLLNPGDFYVCNDGTNISSGTGAAGTGRFDPFLTTFTPKKQKETEEGINTGPSYPFAETFYGGGTPDRTHLIQYSEVPRFEIPAGSGNWFRKFNLDADEQGNDYRYLSLGELKIYAGGNDVGGYTDGIPAGTFANNPQPKLVWNLDAACGNAGAYGAFVAINYRLEEGSGWSDLGLFIPERVFTAQSVRPADYIYMYTLFGDPADDKIIPDGNLLTDDGFEEWGIETGVPFNLPPTLKLEKNIITNYPDQHPVLTLPDVTLFAAGDANQFSYTADLSVWKVVTADYPYVLSESFTNADYVSEGWSCNGGTLDTSVDPPTITLAINDEVTCTVTNHDAEIPVPEFPVIALPIGMIIGFLGVVLYLRSTKEN